MNGLLDSFKQNWLGWVFAALVGAIVTFLLSNLKSLFVIKRKKRCISKRLVSSMVYHNLDKDGLKITVSYKGKIIDQSVSVMKIRLRNDGEEDLFFTHCFSRAIYFRMSNYDIIEVKVSSEFDGVNPKVKLGDIGRYDLSWDLLKKDEYFYVIIVVADEVEDISAVNFDVRAEGISEIKTPEFRAREFLLPVFILSIVLAILVLIFVPNEDTIIAHFSNKLLFILVIAFSFIFLWVLALYSRIRWLKEK